MTELETLVHEKGALTAVLDRINKEIISKQILKEQVMNAFGFIKAVEKTAIVVYTKTFEDEFEMNYDVMLDLTKPNLVQIKREGQEKAYAFEIDSVEDFKDLLIFANI